MRKTLKKGKGRATEPKKKKRKLKKTTEQRKKQRGVAGNLGLKLERRLSMEEWVWRKLYAGRVRIMRWWEKRGKRYFERGNPFFAMTLTFKDEKSYEEFQMWGGRRRFMKEWDRENNNAIKDYLCIVGFQKRGVIYYHYLVVAKKGAFLSYPDRSFFRWGMTYLKRLEPEEVYPYVLFCIKKLKELDYEAYTKWKEKYGRFRLYELGRPFFRRSKMGISDGASVL